MPEGQSREVNTWKIALYIPLFPYLLGQVLSRPNLRARHSRVLQYDGLQPSPIRVTSRGRTSRPQRIYNPASPPSVCAPAARAILSYLLCAELPRVGSFRRADVISLAIDQRYFTTCPLWDRNIQVLCPGLLAQSIPSRTYA